MKRPLERERNRLLQSFTLHFVLYFYFDVIFGDIFVPHAWILMKPSLSIHLLSMTSFVLHITFQNNVYKPGSFVIQKF